MEAASFLLLPPIHPSTSLIIFFKPISIQVIKPRILNPSNSTFIPQTSISSSQGIPSTHLKPHIHIHHSSKQVMETLKPSTHINQSSLCASIGSALSGAAGTDGAPFINPSRLVERSVPEHSPSTPATSTTAVICEKTESSTTLDRQFRWWP